MSDRERFAGFLESLWRDIDMNRLDREINSKSTDLNLVIVSHGVTMRVFLMRWFKWTTAQFELLNNPKNCEIRVMQQGAGGEYSLAVHHSREELQEWGLSPEMIADQEWRATASKGQWNYDWPWSGPAFFDHFVGDLRSPTPRTPGPFELNGETPKPLSSSESQRDEYNEDDLVTMPPI